MGPDMGAPGGAPGGRNIEALVEKIVDEKWREAEVRIEDLESFRTDLHESMAEIREELAELKSRYVELQEHSTVRLEEYSKELEGVGAQINALQRVLQRIFPTIAENVRELSDVVRDMKRLRAKEQVQKIHE